VEFDRRELLAGERDVLGLYVSSHPLADVRDALRRKVDCGLRDLGTRREGEAVTVGGLVAGVRTMTTKRGEPMAFVQLEDLTGACEVVVFANAYGPARALLETDRTVIVRGRVDQRMSGEPKLVAYEVLPFEGVPNRGVVRLAIDARRVPRTALADLKSLVEEFRGDHPVVVELTTSQGPKLLRLGSGFRVRPESAFFAEVRARIGHATLA
jgi:DNA polymerase-3 subunit alpha